MNEQQNKSNKQEEEALKSASGERTAVKGSSWKRLLSKKWVSPAAFIAAAALIVTLMWIYQGTQEQPVTTNETGVLTETAEGNEEGVLAPSEETMEAAAKNEQMQWPVLNREELEVSTPFYEAEASGEDRQAAIVQTDNTFTPHMGIDLSRQDDQSFEVVAAMSGKVSHVKLHPTNGNIVEITHPNGLVTIYQSLTDVQVKTGDAVLQNTIIGKAGRNELEKDHGVHLHFEVRNDEEALNPLALFSDLAN
ncbi:M23 family metallopeptidase [Paenibacillaceae bacterium]|nr:M23 family metallopeptidase [Paenibacillaceae bacterium]